MNKANTPRPFLALLGGAGVVGKATLMSTMAESEGSVVFGKWVSVDSDGYPFEFRKIWLTIPLGDQPWMLLAWSGVHTIEAYLHLPASFDAVCVVIGSRRTGLESQLDQLRKLRKLYPQERYLYVLNRYGDRDELSLAQLRSHCAIGESDVEVEGSAKSKEVGKAVVKSLPWLGRWRYEELESSAKTLTNGVKTLVLEDGEIEALCSASSMKQFSDVLTTTSKRVTASMPLLSDGEIAQIRAAIGGKPLPPRRQPRRIRRWGLFSMGSKEE